MSTESKYNALIYIVVESLVTIFLIQCTFDNHCYPTTNMCIIFTYLKYRFEVG